MHKGNSKTLAVLIVFVLIGTMLCLPVSAETSYEALPITVTKIWTNHVDNNTYTQYDDNYYAIHIPYDAGKKDFASLWTVNNSDTTNYYSYKFKFYFSGIEPSDFTLTFNGITYEVLKNVVDEFETYWYVDIHDIKLNSPNSRLDFSFSWNSASTAYVYFQAFYLYSDLNAIIDNQNENTDKIIDNQNSNTQDIIDNQNALAEKEKQEISDSGNQATDAADSIPNESEGFINALTTFVSTMSTTDTSCSITFPAIKIPSIAGIPAATLTEETEVDFTEAVNLLPEAVLELIRALTTIALIIYCFKELYDTISEALTRKKANSDG